VRNDKKKGEKMKFSKWTIFLIVVLLTAQLSLAQNETKKFRTGPTVTIKPLNDHINRSSDGLIEIYIDNPSINEVPLTFDAHISVPSGIHVYGQGFGTVAAGVLYAFLVVPPGTVRTAYVNIKAENIGDFFTQFTGIYYPGDNKDAYQQISLSYPFSVYEASPDPTSSKLTNPTQIPNAIPSSSGGDNIMDKVIPGFILAILAGLVGLIYKIFEMKYAHKLESDSKTVKSKVTETKEGTTRESETTETKTVEEGKK
jgi:hypothetical protein